MIYLATPYTHELPFVMEKRFKMACRIAGLLMQHGDIVFCPIAHTHPIAMACPDMPQTDSEYWMKFDRKFLEMADRLVVVQMPGWKQSKGIRAEMKIANELGKPIEFLSGFGKGDREP